MFGNSTFLVKSANSTIEKTVSRGVSKHQIVAAVVSPLLELRTKNFFTVHLLLCKNRSKLLNKAHDRDNKDSTKLNFYGGSRQSFDVSIMQDVGMLNL